MLDWLLEIGLYLLGVALIPAIGLLLVCWGLWGDRSKGRSRCPKCWYDMRGTAPRLECPECGHDAGQERRRKRRAPSSPGLSASEGSNLLSRGRLRTYEHRAFMLANGVAGRVESVDIGGGVGAHGETRGGESIDDVRPVFAYMVMLSK
jgi:hypothetical protein